VNFSTSEVSFAEVSKERIKRAKEKISSMGYTVVDPMEENKKGLSSIEKKFYFSIIFTFPLLMAMFLPFPLLHNPFFQLILTIPVFLLGLIHFGKSAYHSLRSGVPNMDVLIILGATAAFIYSLIGTINQMGHNYLFYETTASIISLILLGNMLEHIAVKRTTSAIDDLVKMQRVMAKKIVIGQDKQTELIQEVEAAKIMKDDLLLINSGDKIPVDGETYWGKGSVDESMLTGESMPVEKSYGDSLIGGTILLSGNLKMKVTAVGKQTVLSQIIGLVKNAQQDKPTLQSLADKISAVFVPVVVTVSLLTFVISYFLFNVGFQSSLMHSIAVLVIACPCALGLAIPTAVIVGVGRVAKNGILIKGGSTLQKFSSVKKIIFDKTGTLTTGDFKIKKIYTLDGVGEDEVRTIILSLEQYSSHPIARSLLRELSDRKAFETINVTETKGLGINAEDRQGRKYQLGSFEIAKSLTADNSHSLYLLEDGKLISFIDIEDELKPEAAECIGYFNKLGIETILLSGDKEEKCKVIAEKTGISKVYSEKSPEEKLRIIEELAKEGDVAMVGDGINDAPALAKATVGISLSNATQVAIKSAQVILMNGNLSLLPKAYAISTNTIKIIKQNLFWAFFYNVIAIPIAAIGLLNPMIAAASMAISDVVVVFNSLRLKNKRLN
jgi:Cu+-exporting ATPase